VSDDVDRQKTVAAETAADFIEDGMRIGLGTGSTVAFLLPALARRELRNIRCIATSEITEQFASALGLPIEPFDTLDRLDVAIDGADQVTPDRWLIKGGGGAHTREKIAAAAADRFIVIVSRDKLVEKLHPPVPVEILTYGRASTLARLQPCTVREGAGPSPDGGIIADYKGPIGDDPAELAARLSGTPGVVDHGIFEPALVDDVIVGR
jgi:ribose 5-phosphate isomerase A